MIYSIYVDVLKKLCHEVENRSLHDLSSKDVQIGIADLFFKASRQISNIENHDLENFLLDYSADFDWLSLYSDDPENYRIKLDEAIQSIEALIPKNVQSSLDILK